MAKTAKQLWNEATDAFYAEDMVAVEEAMTEMQARFPASAVRLRQQFEDIIWERTALDDIGEIEL